ncbi:MAG: ChaN family lipoprotein [Planctomycetes bacterium]|nr:ChaN family lipoprotein [Planctomycetota bacterium]
MRTPRSALSLCLPLLAACASAPNSVHGANAAEQRTPWSAPPLELAISVRDGRTGERLTLDALLDGLAGADAVFLGETHIDETTHAVELAVFEGLHARRAGKVVLALEMFERDVQPVLDRYLRGEVDERAFLSAARPWSNYRTAYRPLVESARLRGVPVVASNFPATLRRKLGSGGLDGLEPSERALAPAQLFANTPGYWRRVDNAVRGHLGMMGPTPAPDDPRLTSTQSLWDNSMGEACALALARHPGHAVVHVNGGFHSEYWDGTARQLALRAPHARIATIAIVPSGHPAVEELGSVPVADYVVFCEERAQDLDEGTHAVFVPREQEYRLHVPPAATDRAPAPLLVWLVDDGESAEDALRLWKQRVGDQAAVLVLEPPYRELQDDLVEGGRWFFPDSFRPDLAAAREGVERAWAYVLRRLPVDPARVCVAGEGAGATIAAAAGVWGGALEARVLSFEPRRFAALKEFPLPLPELRGSAPAPRRSLRVAARPADEAWWSAELEAYRGVGLDAGLAPAASGPWDAEIARENAVREALGLAPRSFAPDAPRAHVRVDGPRGRSWARLFADQRAVGGQRIAILEGQPPADSGSRELVLEVLPAECAQPGRIPRCPGPFGGTTVLVVPDARPAEERAAWLALESSPAASLGRFHRLAVATESGERALTVVLGELEAAGRRNVLVIPAAWSADGATMRGLRRSVRDFDDRLTIRWRPGLGGLDAGS